MEVYEPTLIPFQKLSVLELYMQAFKLSGNNSKYEFYLNQWITLTKTETASNIDANQNLIEAYSANAIEQAIQQIKTEKELLNQKLVIEKQERRLQKWFLIGGALSVILFILFFLYRYRRRAWLKAIELKLAKKEQDFPEIKSSRRE